MSDLTAKVTQALEKTKDSVDITNQVTKALEKNKEPVSVTYQRAKQVIKHEPQYLSTSRHVEELEKITLIKNPTRYELKRLPLLGKQVDEAKINFSWPTQEILDKHLQHPDRVKLCSIDVASISKQKNFDLFGMGQAIEL